jgi:NTP pyrophosphatase (non-canonical NTP hydrolase)
MTFQDMRDKALAIRKKYAKFEKEKYGKGWTKEQLVKGFVKDVDDLMKLVSAREKNVDVENFDQKLRHELADCLWSTIVIAEEYEVDLKEAFFETMEELGARLSK